jgi:hypothetical protein
MKQGINSRGTGNLLSRTGNLQRLAGNCPPCAGIRAEAQSDARPSPHGPRVDQSGAQSYSEASTGAFYWARKFEALGDQVKLRSSRTKRGESRVPLRGKRNSRLERGFKRVRRGKAAEFDPAMRRFDRFFLIGGNRPGLRGLGRRAFVSGRQFLAVWPIGGELFEDRFCWCRPDERLWLFVGRCHTDAILPSHRRSSKPSA